tara:strand:- start:760 stop:1446 length:687 start_codon:yes stop_codon:yes gene_type:complete
LKAYQDLRGNQEAEVLVAPIRFDIETLDFTVQSPVTNTRLALESTVTFALPEDALPGSVQLKFTRTSGTIDSNAARVVVLSSSMESSGSHTFTLKQLETAVATVAEIVSVTPAISLIHATEYSVEFSYQDRAGNLKKTVTITNLECDVATDPVVSLHPAQSSNGAATFMNNIFEIQFTLPEAAAAGSLKLVIESTGTDRIGTIDYELPRTVVLSNTIGKLKIIKVLRI